MFPAMFPAMFHLLFYINVLAYSTEDVNLKN